MYQRAASTVLYSGVVAPSGKWLGSMPRSMKRAKVARTRLATPGRPVARARPGSEIMVSRPQSSNHGYPAITESPSGESGSGRFTTNWSAASTSCFTHSGAWAALGAAFSQRDWIAEAYLP